MTGDLKRRQAAESFMEYGRLPRQAGIPGPSPKGGFWFASQTPYAQTSAAASLSESGHPGLPALRRRLGIIHRLLPMSGRLDIVPAAATIVLTPRDARSGGSLPWKTASPSP